MSTATLDAFEQLDQALADVRHLSHLIAQAVGMSEAGIPCPGGDTWAAVIEQLSISREKVSDEVTELLRLTATMLPESVR